MDHIVESLVSWLRWPSIISPRSYRTRHHTHTTRSNVIQFSVFEIKRPNGYTQNVVFLQIRIHGSGQFIATPKNMFSFCDPCPVNKLATFALASINSFLPIKTILIIQPQCILCSYFAQKIFWWLFHFFYWFCDKSNSCIFFRDWTNSHTVDMALRSAQGRPLDPTLKPDCGLTVST